MAGRNPSPYASKPFPESWTVSRILPPSPAPVGVSPAHERDFQILSSSKMMARRWERSPRNRKRFMAEGIWQGWAGGSQAEGGLPPGAAVLAGRLGWGAGEVPSGGLRSGEGALGGVAEDGAGGRARARKREAGGREGEESGREAPPPRAESRLSSALYLAHPPTPTPACRVGAEFTPLRPPPRNLRGRWDPKLANPAPVPPGSPCLSVKVAAQPHRFCP